jgi:alkylated DNA repair dioxygenase AlkB
VLIKLSQTILKMANFKSESYCNDDKIETLEPFEEKMRYELGEGAWITLEIVSETFGLTMNEFDDLWKLKPNEQLLIKGKNDTIYKCPRHSQSYLKDYTFSGLNHESLSKLPPRIEKLLNDSKEKLNPNLNQSLINWYDSFGSIGKHSDDTNQLLPDSEIFSFSFGNFTNKTFILEPKAYTKNKTIYQINLKHNTLIIMGGTCQKKYLHSVPKSPNNGNRINVTFRCFRNK